MRIAGRTDDRTRRDVGVVPANVEAAVDRLRLVLEELGNVVVAFSGGADSAFLASVAHRTLGPERALCVTAVSPSLAPEEEANCRSLAGEWGLAWSPVATQEMHDPAYVANGPDRCARCKDALMDALGPLARQRSATVVLGVNTDDLGDYRPGQDAAAAAGARFPLVDAGLSKADVREASRRMGLRTWDRPAGACLASRVPYGTPVTAPTLRSVSEAEAGVRAIGFRDVRVRHHGTVARLEVGPAELERAFRLRQALVGAVRAAGYTYVALDLEGFRSGSLNRVLEAAGHDPEPSSTSS
jgi:pyridinium-3,5-biscarboxylic acid mononucleotide sulfurtransferase